MDSVLWPRETGEFVCERSRDVFVEDLGVKRVAEMLYTDRDRLAPQTWLYVNPLAPKCHSQEAFTWIFVVDTMNFSFWHERGEEPCSVTHRGQTHTGYMSLCAAVTRALDEGVPLTDASYMSSVTLEELSHVLRSDTLTPMPMLQERHAALTQAGRVLLQHGGSLKRFLGWEQRDARQLVTHVVETLSSYRDEAVYEGRKVAFYKRAQILVADLWCLLEARGEPSITNISELTMFADYRVPQALVYLGVLRYSHTLMEKLQQDTRLGNGDRLEVEIRGCSLCAVEKIKTCVCELMKRDGQHCDNINSAIIDFYLWSYAKEKHKDMTHVPIHHTRCIYY